MKDIREIIQLSTDYLQKHGIESPKVDAEWLIGHALKLERMQLYLQFDRPLNDSELTEIRALLKRRASHEPVQYICGSACFFGLDFKVGPGVLVPRPETERLVDLALQETKDGDRLLDVCTGSGCIPLTMQHEKNNSLEVTATELSPEALNYARENANLLKAENFTLLQGDLLSPLPAGAQFEVITSNPPYVADSERPQMGKDVLKHEPDMALFAENEGLQIIERLAREVKNFLVEDGFFFMEFGASQGPAIKTLFEQHGYRDVEIIQDYSHRDRILKARK